MLKFYFLLIGVFAFSHSSILGQKSYGTKSKNNIPIEIEQVIEDQRKAALQNDVSKIEQLLSSDYISTNANGEVRNKEQTIAFYKLGELKYNTIVISDVYIRILSPEAAVANFKITTKEFYKGENTSGQFRVTRVFVKEKKQWTIIANHSTSLTQ